MGADTAGAAIVRALRSDVERFTAAEPDVRADRDDAVHQMRVATRRLRSVFRTYRKVFERNDIDHLRAELKWFGGELGTARDAEVIAMRFDTLLRELTPALTDGPVYDRLVTTYRSRYQAALADIHREFDTPRYTDLRRALADVTTSPRFTPRADKPAGDVLSAGLAREHSRLRADVHTAFTAEPSNRDQPLHEVRKSAKRLRYAGEAAQPVLGGSAERISRTAKKVQAILGDHRDAVEAQHVVLTTCDSARADGEDTFVYGQLHTTLEAAAQAALAGYPRALESLTSACAELAP